MNDNGSLYDFVSGDYEAPTVANNAPVETPHQNRADLSKPYSSDFNKKVRQAATDSEPKTSANYEWMLLITNRQSSNHIAINVNAKFVRNNITGDNFQQEKERYFNEYKTEMMK